MKNNKPLTNPNEFFVLPSVPRKVGWWLIMLGALSMALYGLAYLILGERVYPDPLADSFGSRPWGIYSHAFFGILTIIIGPLQFRRSLLKQQRALHRQLGKVYVVAALGTGLSGLYMALYAYGGWISQLGFSGMAVAMLVTTAAAYLKIRRREVAAHRTWMIRSYAVMFSAVTFRLWLGTLLLISGGAFTIAYQAAAWLAWVLNLIGVEWYLQQTRRRPIATYEGAALR